MSQERQRSDEHANLDLSSKSVVVASYGQAFQIGGVCVLQCVAVCCSVVLCIAAWYECVASYRQGCRIGGAFVYLACVDMCVCVSVLQCVAVCCSVLQCGAVHCSVV